MDSHLIHEREGDEDTDHTNHTNTDKDKHIVDGVDPLDMNSEDFACKLCTDCSDEDMNTQFFASGPFYAMDSSVETIGSEAETLEEVMDRRQRSDKCSVLYAEMPHLFDNKVQLTNDDIPDHNSTSDHGHSDTICDTHHTNRSTQLGTCVDPNYQFVCYKYCSPLSVGRVSQLDHHLYYISNNEPNIESEAEINDNNDNHNHNSHLSSPLMLTFCKHNAREDDTTAHNTHTSHTNDCDNELNESVNCGQRAANYTTVIKPKALRPQLAMDGHSVIHTNVWPLIPSTLPTLSFHGSTHVLTDKDESAFTQISRRRSNSEATHYYQTLNNENEIPSRSDAHNNRPLRPQRSKSVNKTYNNFDQSLVRSDRHLFDSHTNDTKTYYLSNKYRDSCNECHEWDDEKQHLNQTSEPIHMTLEEVRHFFSNNQTKCLTKHQLNTNDIDDRISLSKSKSKSKIKCAIESLFRSKRKSGSPVLCNQYNTNEPQFMDQNSSKGLQECVTNMCLNDSTSPFTHRALPPLPSIVTPLTNAETSAAIDRDVKDDERQKFLDYAASIERVKDCGWYWGPISGEMAEKLLESEPCGSFIVRDSSDEHYIFSLTFKLNGLVRHVRIEHDQGNFSFGSLQKFKSNTIVDFIENAVQHSRSGRFLFFLHRRPVMGPMRVQLLHPVSRFKQIQSLQHMCRFVILKHVRRDLIEGLPLPKMLKTYLNTPYYYSEELALMNEGSNSSHLNHRGSQLELTTSPNTSQSLT